MANLIFPTGTYDDGGMLLEVHLAGSTQFLLCMYINWIYVFLLIKHNYAHYIATHVTRISIYSLHLEMNE